MPTEHLVSNFNSLLLSVNKMRPKRDGKFITRVFLTSPPSKENFKIDPKDFPFEYEIGTADKSKVEKIEEPDDGGDAADDDTDDDKEAVKAKN